MLIQEAADVMQEATGLVVQTISARQRAADLWDAIRAFRKQAETQKETVCRPLKTAWDDAKVPYDAFVKECQGYEATLQKAMSEWDRKQEALARAEQAKIQAAIDAKNAKIIEKAEAKGIEPILKVAPVVVAPPKSIETQAGTTQSRSTKKVYTIKVSVNSVPAPEWNAAHVEVAQLLKEYPQLFVLDKVKFNQLAKTGMLDNHPNVTIEETFVYSQR
jgi:hypothetical protein